MIVSMNWMVSFLHHQGKICSELSQYIHPISISSLNNSTANDMIEKKPHPDNDTMTTQIKPEASSAPKRKELNKV